ncbi:hypothetical protein LCGC14_1235390 [marine sediment metagenome]|uniref:RNA polymerase sigma-70 region 4 domain-containing protein n=1 Tax=marine sediment metagenome TaxID=412755 RepID=A0A0F9NPG3_9ZZZZ
MARLTTRVTGARHIASSLRESGYTLQEIADELGYTRERIRQFLKSRDEVSLPLCRFSEHLGLPVAHLSVACKALGFNTRACIPWSRLPDIQKKFYELYRSRCPQCKEVFLRSPLGEKKPRRFCGPTCYKKWWLNYANWSPERKAKHKALVSRWQREHHEELRERRHRSNKARYDRRHALGVKRAKATKRPEAEEAK